MANLCIDATSCYIYSVLDDFPNQAVASDKLDREITESSIVENLESITVHDATCYITFDFPLSPTDEDTLNGIVAVHDGVPDPIYPKPDIKYLFGRNGAVHDGYLLTVGGIASTDQGYYVQRKATIVGFSIKATSGDYITKEIYIQNDEVNISSMFQLDSNLEYKTQNLNIDIDDGYILQVYITGEGPLVNALAQIDIAWR